MASPRIRRAAFGSYFTQVSLLIVSVLLALAVDRCQQSRKDAARWVEYRTLIVEELERELNSTQMNIADNANDIAGLEAAMAAVPAEETAAQLAVAGQVGLVIGRGVFRTFPPLTYALMVSNGDSHLLEDLDLRQRLAAYASFREDYIQHDLVRHDELTLELIDRVGAYLDLLCLRRTSASDPSCITDPARMRRELPQDVAKVYRHSILRGFHLQKGEGLLEELLERFEE